MVHRGELQLRTGGNFEHYCRNPKERKVPVICWNGSDIKGDIDGEDNAILEC